MLKRILFTIITLLVSTLEVQAFVKKIDEIPKEDQKTLGQVKLEKGGQIMLEQYLVKKEKFNEEDAYRVVFHCPRTKKAKLAECKIIKYEIFDKQLR